MTAINVEKDKGFTPFAKYIAERPPTPISQPVVTQQRGVLIPAPVNAPMAAQKVALPQESAVYMHPFKSERGVMQGALLSFSGKINDDILRRFKENYSVEGDHIKTGGAMSPQTMLTLIGSAAAAMGVSAVASDRLFMATVDPATLIKYKDGTVSSIVKGITGHAGFVELPGQFMSVTAPLLAFAAIATITIMNQFEGIHRRLDHIEKSISRIIQRSEATHVGETLSALNRIEEIEHQFSICNRFTPDMMIRLALLESNVNPIFERYHFLYQSQGINQSAEKEDLKFKQNDAYFAIILSILDLRIELLQLKLAIQDNPGYMKHAASRLAERVQRYQRLWDDIGKNSGVAETVASEIRETVEDMSWWEKQAPSWMGGKRKERKSLEKKAADLESHALGLDDALGKELVAAKKVGKGVLESVAPQKPMNLIYWKDELGEHAYYTSDLELLPAK